VARGVTTILVADRGKNVTEDAIDTMAAEFPVHREGPGREWPLFETIPIALVTERVSD